MSKPLSTVLAVVALASATSAAEKPSPPRPIAAPLGSGYGTIKKAPTHPTTPTPAPTLTLTLTPTPTHTPIPVTTQHKTLFGGQVTKTQERAQQARATAGDAERTAARAEAEVTTADQAERDARQTWDRAAARLGTARWKAQGARQRLSSARQNVREWTEVLQQAQADVTASRKFGARVASLFTRWFGVDAEMDAAQQLELAQQRLAGARGLVETLELEDGFAADEETTAQRLHDQAHQRLQETSSRLRERRTQADQARQGAVTALATAKTAEGEATAAQARRRHALTMVDQHRIGMGQKSVAQKRRYREAAQRFQLTSFIEPRPNESSQDAVSAAPEEGWFAIADGVSESDYCGELARALVRRWTDRPPQGLGDFGTWFAGVQSEWVAETRPLIAANATAWYNQGAEAQGYATFVGARLRAAQGKLDLYGTGDSVAFLVRGGRISGTFPYGHSAEFSNQVKALPGRGAPEHPARHVSWDVRPGDEVFLATDAVSAWLFREAEQGRDGFERLRGIKAHLEMTRFIADARSGALGGGKMGVDDSAFVRFVVPGGAP